MKIKKDRYGKYIICPFCHREKIYLKNSYQIMGIRSYYETCSRCNSSFGLRRINEDYVDVDLIRKGDPKKQKRKNKYKKI